MVMRMVFTGLCLLLLYQPSLGTESERNSDSVESGIIINEERNNSDNAAIQNINYEAKQDNATSIEGSDYALNGFRGRGGRRRNGDYYHGYSSEYEYEYSEEYSDEYESECDNPKCLEEEEDVLCMEPEEEVCEAYDKCLASTCMKSKSCHDYLCKDLYDCADKVLILHRGQYDNEPDYFNRNFEDYEKGMGGCDQEYWMGLQRLHKLTSNGRTWNLVVNLQDDEGPVESVLYANFKVGPPPTYVLSLGTFSSASSMLQNALEYHNGASFSAQDRDNDLAKGSQNCALNHKGGWWHKDCFYTNLMGLNLPGKETTNGILWKFNHGYKSFPWAWMYAIAA